MTDDLQIKQLRQLSCEKIAKLATFALKAINQPGLSAWYPDEIAWRTDVLRKGGA